MDSRRIRPNARRIPAGDQFVKEQEQIDEDEVEEADEMWPARLPSSARRYQGPGDVSHEVGRSADVRTQVQVSRGGLVRTTGERHLIPARRTAQPHRPPALPVVSHVPRSYLDEDEDEGQIVHTQTRGQSQGTGRVQKRVPARAGQAVRGQDQARYRVRPHWLFFVGVAMLTMLLGWVALSALGSWWQTTLDDWHYGRPRTYQTDAVVGHHDSARHPSHFIAMNLNGHIMVIEIPGGDPSKSVIYTGPTLSGPGQDLTPVTLSFRDVNHDGTLDMIVNVQNSEFIFLNEHGTFVPANQNSNSTG